MTVDSLLCPPCKDDRTPAAAGNQTTKAPIAYDRHRGDQLGNARSKVARINPRGSLPLAMQRSHNRSRRDDCAGRLLRVAAPQSPAVSVGLRTSASAHTSTGGPLQLVE